MARGSCTAGGVFIRFPDPVAATTPGRTPLAGQRGPALLEIPFVAIGCGQEIQINDGTADPQATGSIYNFRSLRLAQAGVVPQGRWSSYGIRIRGGGDYAVQVIRNGRLLNAVALRVPRRRVLEYRSLDFAGHVEPTRRRVLRPAR